MYDITSKISFIMQKKKDKILELKNDKDKLKRKMYLSFLSFAIPFLWIIQYMERFIPSFTGSSKLFPDIKPIDYIALLLTVTAAMFLYFYTQRYIKTKGKFDTLRHSIMDDIGSMICNCHEQCTCREDFIKEMDEKGIDLIMR